MKAKPISLAISCAIVTAVVTALLWIGRDIDAELARNIYLVCLMLLLVMASSRLPTVIERFFASRGITSGGRSARIVHRAAFAIPMAGLATAVGATFPDLLVRTVTWFLVPLWFIAWVVLGVRQDLKDNP